MERTSAVDGPVKNSRPFLIQYLTLMLIVLSFMVGSFASRSIVPDAEPKKPEIKPLPPVAVDTFTLEDFFEPGTAVAREGKIEALQALFSAHDIDAQITAFSDGSEAGDAALAHALARALTVQRALEIPTIPSAAVRTFGALRQHGQMIEIRLFHHALSAGGAA